LERMVSEFNKELDLKTLAAETGYSRIIFFAYFVRQPARRRISIYCTSGS
jgi:hypothetical protein